MKKFIYILICIALISMQVFAGGESDGSGNGGNIEKTEDGKIILRFWHAFSDSKRRDWIQARADEWNSQNQEYFMIPESKGSYQETLNASFLAVRQGTAPSLVHVFEVGSQQALDSGVFKPVSEVGTIDYSDYIEPVLNYYTIDGAVNSIPFNSSSPILYYNKDLMKKAGLDPEKPPTTLQQIIDYSDIAKEKGIESAGIGFPLHAWLVEQWMSEQNALFANNDNGRSARATEVYITSPEMVKIATLIKELYDKGHYKYTGKAADWSGSDTLFTEERVMFHITSTADLGNISEAVKDKFDLGTGYFPTPTEARNGVVIGGGSVWLVDGHPLESLQAAQDFLLYMTDTNNMVDWHKVTGYYPVRNSSITVLEDENWFSDFPARTIAFTQLLETNTNNASAGALIGSFIDTRNLLQESLQQMFTGVSVDDALGEVHEKINAKLQEYNQNVQ